MSSISSTDADPGEEDERRNCPAPVGVADGTTSKTNALAAVAAAAAATRARESHLQLAGEKHARYYSAAVLSLPAPFAATDDKDDDDDGDGAMDDDIDDDCNGMTGDNGDKDSMDYDNDGNGATDDDVDDDDGNRTTNGNRTTEVDVNEDGYGTSDDNIDDNCDGATDGRHRLEACGGCATKVTRGVGTRQQATRQTAGERDAIGRRGASVQEATGLDRPSLRV